MATPDTLVTAVRRALTRTVAGSLAGLALGVIVLGTALGPGLWSVAMGGQSLSTAWSVGRADTAGTDQASPEARAQRQVSRLSERRNCTPDGFGPDVIPASALVQVQGRVRSVSFDEGWAIHRGERPGRLLAVCLT